MRSALLIALAGCSGPNTGTQDRSDIDDATTTAETETEASSDSGFSETPTVAPAWWSLQGTLALAGGVVDPPLSVVEISLLDAEETVLCVLSGAPISVTDAPLPDPGLLTWWTVLPPAAPDACGTLEPFTLGVGPYDPLLDPGAAAAGVDPTALNGLYTLSGDALWVFGVAGSPAQFDDDAPPITAAPLPDGELGLTSLYLLPL